MQVVWRFPVPACAGEDLPGSRLPGSGPGLAEVPGLDLGQGLGDSRPWGYHPWSCASPGREHRWLLATGGGARYWVTWSCWRDVAGRGPASWWLWTTLPSPEVSWRGGTPDAGPDLVVQSRLVVADPLPTPSLGQATPLWVGPWSQRPWHVEVHVEVPEPRWYPPPCMLCFPEDRTVAPLCAHRRSVEAWAWVCRNPQQITAYLRAWRSVNPSVTGGPHPPWWPSPARGPGSPGPHLDLDWLHWDAARYVVAPWRWPAGWPEALTATVVWYHQACLWAYLRQGWQYWERHGRPRHGPVLRQLCADTVDALQWMAHRQVLPRGPGVPGWNAGETQAWHLRVQVMWTGRTPRIVLWGYQHGVPPAWQLRSTLELDRSAHLVWSSG